MTAEGQTGGHPATVCSLAWGGGVPDPRGPFLGKVCFLPLCPVALSREEADGQVPVISWPGLGPREFPECACLQLQGREDKSHLPLDGEGPAEPPLAPRHRRRTWGSPLTPVAASHPPGEEPGQTWVHSSAGGGSFRLQEALFLHLQNGGPCLTVFCALKAIVHVSCGESPPPPLQNPSGFTISAVVRRVPVLTRDFIETCICHRRIFGQGSPAFVHVTPSPRRAKQLASLGFCSCLRL